MNILVTGASGFVGTFLCKSLLAKGEKVVAVTRNMNAKLENVQLVIKELHEHTAWDDTLMGIDVVIHLAGRAHVMKEKLEDPYQVYAETNIYATKNLAAQAAVSGVKRFIFISSIKVNGEETVNRPYIETDKPAPEDDYAITKLLAENELKLIADNTTMDVVIIRPPLIYGKGVKANFQNLMWISKLPIPLPFGAINNKRSLVYVENLVDFIMLCTRHPKAANETFLISDGDDVSTTHLIKSIIKISGGGALLIPVPQLWLKAILKLLGKTATYIKLCGNLQLDITKAKNLLGWKPPYTFEQGITKTIQDQE